MALICVLLIAALEFYFKLGAEYRSFSWFTTMQDKLVDVFEQRPFYEGWVGVAIILLLPVVLLWIFVNLFSGYLYFLVFFLVSCAILFFSLGPKSLTASFAHYFQAMERGDQEAAFLALQQEDSADDVLESEEIVRNATRVILVESQSRYFGVIFWFIFFGPFGALFYRLAHQYYATCKNQGNDDHLQLVTQLLHWIDWAPARLTSLLFLLTGDFVNGFYRVKDYLLDLAASNRQIISETGVAALGIEIGMTNNDVQENHDAFGMVQRTIILYIVLVAGLSPFALW